MTLTRDKRSFSAIIDRDITGPWLAVTAHCTTRDSAVIISQGLTVTAQPVIRGRK